MRQIALIPAAGVGLRFVVELEAGKRTVRLEKALQVLQALRTTAAGWRSAGC